MASPLQILRLYGIKPRRTRGQNFLIDQNIVRKIVEKADIKKTDSVAEIGAGIGVLTRELALRAKKVFAVEIDEKLIAVLQSELKNGKNDGKNGVRHKFLSEIEPDPIFAEIEPDPVFANVAIIHANARKLPNTAFAKKDFSYRVIANIPYNLTSFLIGKFLEQEPRPADMILMLQKEVGERICAKPPQMSILSVFVQEYADAKILFRVPKTCFFPKPKVDSVCISLALKKDRSPTSAQAHIFSRVVKTGFSAKRKLLAKNLSQGLAIPPEDIKAYFIKAGISLNARAQELSCGQWEDVARFIHCTPLFSTV